MRGRPVRLALRRPRLRRAPAEHEGIRPPPDRLDRLPAPDVAGQVGARRPTPTGPAPARPRRDALSPAPAPRARADAARRLPAVVPLPPPGPRRRHRGAPRHEHRADAASSSAELRAYLGLDRPLPLQYLGWLGALLRGDAGYSLRTGQPVVGEIASRLPVTLELALAAALVALLDRPPARDRVGAPAELGARPDGAEPRAPRALAPELLAGHALRAPARALPPVDAEHRRVRGLHGGSVGQPPVPPLPRADARRGDGGRRHADDPLGHARRPRRRLRPDRPRQGPRRLGGGRPPRAAEQPDRRRHDPGRPGRAIS